MSLGDIYVVTDYNILNATAPDLTNISFTYNAGLSIIPEPSTYVLAGVFGLVGAGGAWLRRKRAAA